jgi:hypothetical protein
VNTGEPLGVYLLRFIPLGFGLGIFNAPNNSAIMGSAPNRRLGVASGLLALTRILGQITGIAVLGALWATRVAARAGGLPAAGLSAAPPTAQLGGLQDAMSVAAVVVLVAFSLAAWALRVEHSKRRLPVSRSPGN